MLVANNFMKLLQQILCNFIVIDGKKIISMASFHFKFFLGNFKI